MNEPVKILFVDDERNVLKAIERLFMDDDYEILTANSGEEGLSVLENEYPVHLVISDYKMPGMNGVEFLRHVFRKWPDTVRIVFSGYADTASIVEAINEGQIYKFIPKPWNDDDLKITIANSIEWYCLNKKNLKLAEELREKNRELMDLNANLERIVSERTSELIFQNRVLSIAQNILDLLPVGVTGIDMDDMIVQCNRKAMDFFGDTGRIMIGTDRRDIFEEDLNNFTDRVIRNKYLREIMLLNGKSIKISGVFMQSPDGQEGIILVFDEVY
ncbi:MAG: response regulator [Candidatus Eremiobacterota bacterium]